MAQAFSEAEFLRRMKVYEAGTEVLRHMIVPLCEWGETRHEPLAVMMIELASDYSLVGQGAYTEMWKQLRLYPSLLLLYTGGVAALSADNYEMFTAVLTRPGYHDHNGEQLLLLELSARSGALRADLRAFLSRLYKPPHPNMVSPAYQTIFNE